MLILILENQRTTSLLSIAALQLQLQQLLLLVVLPPLNHTHTLPITMGGIRIVLPGQWVPRVGPRTVDHKQILTMAFLTLRATVTITLVTMTWPSLPIYIVTWQEEGRVVLLPEERQGIV
jgi:hypothetical protein